MAFRKYIIFSWIAFLIVSCKDKYDPPLVSMPNTLLVVEGNINPAGVTTVRLTRTFKLDANSVLQFENNAQVVVEGKNNNTVPLFFSGSGNYSTNVPFGVGNEYRLRIRTTAGKEYLSDYVKTQQTPLIDSISWERDSRGVTIQANTHDATDATRYYRWDYQETWEYHSFYSSNLVFENGNIRNRVFPNEDVRVCWSNYTSTNILLGNSTKLQRDIISKAPLVFIPQNDEKISQRYSILVKQYALDKNGYGFYELLRKNTESIGSIFDAQPSEIKGNITCLSDTREPVIGYLTASTVNEKRLFISRSEVVPWAGPSACELYRVRKNTDSIKEAIGMGLIPIDELIPDPYYSFSLIPCVDCRAKGGTTIRPSFW